MADFRTHVTVSSLCGVGYAAAGVFAWDVPVTSSLIAGGLCGLGGMLPDLDSDNGIPVREMLAFLGAAMPMMFIERLRHMDASNETIVLAGTLIYLTVRFVAGTFLKKFTIHRGMFHSLPAAAIAGLAVFLITDTPDTTIRVYKSLGIVLGFMSHLTLDEIYSFDLNRGRLKIKKSFGTACKFFGPSPVANTAAYGILLLMIAVSAREITVPTGQSLPRLPAPLAEQPEIEHSLR